MKYQIFKLHFTTGVHFGNGGLTQANSILYADTIFSALCTEAVKMGNNILERLVQAVRDDKLRLSDGLPYIADQYYVPKPMVRLQLEKKGDSDIKKLIKKLTFIPISALTDYMNGAMDIAQTVHQFHQYFAKSFLAEKAAIHGLDESMPYALEAYAYGKNQAESGLYLCVAYSDDTVIDLVKMLLKALSLTGIGGKISAGYGKFEVTPAAVDNAFQKRFGNGYTTYMLLSPALPSDAELSASLDGASYRLMKRSGFVASTTYADTFRKKKDVYVFKTGSCFDKKFKGQLLDVSDGGSHPVYRYAKPLFLGVR